MLQEWEPLHRRLAENRYGAQRSTRQGVAPGATPVPPYADQDGINKLVRQLLAALKQLGFVKRNAPETAHQPAPSLRTTSKSSIPHRATKSPAKIYARESSAPVDAITATSAWSPLDPGDVGATVAGQPITALVRPQTDHLDLFMVGTDGHVQSMFFENGIRKSLWFPLRPKSFQAFPGQPVTAIWRDDKHLDLFANAANGRISSIYFANDAWQPAWFQL